MMPYWSENIVPDLRAVPVVLVVAHGNSLRALLKHLEGLSEPEIEGINLPTGVPKVYKLNDRMLSAEAHFHGDPDEIRARIQSVAHQTKKG